MKVAIDQCLSVAWEAADAAGEIIRDNWRRPKNIDFKDAIDLVTSVDRESERKIVETIRRYFPDHSILAEEETDVQGSQQESRWVVDPLDGTTNFAHSYPQFCISIALEQNRRVILALVYDPLRRECFRAVADQGATLDGERIAVSTIDRLDRALLATGFPYDHRDHTEFYLSYFEAFTKRSQGIRRGGSAALDLCYVACGRLDGFWEMKLKPWDTAAGTLIVTEAGGQLSNFSGQPFSIWGNETLASNRLIHAEMLDALRMVHL
jgi:myo-inositol-1(or 4)-monophosphatase